MRLIRSAALLLACGLLPVITSAQPGPKDRPKIDAESAARGRALYLLHCINCHGSLAQGTDDGPDLVRSVAVLRDRAGSDLGAAIKRLPSHKSDFSPAQMADLSSFLKQRVEYVAQDRNASKPPDVLTGNADAGRSYFNGAGQCATCHSSSENLKASAGNLKGIAALFDPVTLQQRFLFPRTVPIKVAVKLPSGERVDGTLFRIDDFSVSLRDATGDSKSYSRGPGVDVTLDDPLTAHHELLDRINDREIHDVVAYLETLK